MNLDTQRTLRATRVGWPLALNTGDVESDWMVPLLVEEEREMLMAWQLGISL